MRGLWRCIACLAALLAPAAAHSAHNAVRSCYPASRIGVPPPAPTRAVFVLIDQTTGLDRRLRETIATNVERLLQPGTTFSVATFSAYSRGHFTTVLTSGTIEATIPRHLWRQVSVPARNRLNSCLAGQQRFAARMALHTIAQATNHSVSDFRNSEIMGSLSQLSAAVRASPGQDKIVIVVSDLLEHTPDISFYRNRGLRQIDPAAEMALAVRHGLIGNFGGARVAVIGAGLLAPGSGANSVRPIPARNALRSFWEMWFRRSRARLIAYGEPDLVMPIQ